MAGSFQSRLRLILGFAFAAVGGLALSGGAQAAPGVRDAAIVVAATTIAEVADETQSPQVPAAEGAPDAAADPGADAVTAKAEPEKRRRLDIDCLPKDLLERLRAAHGPSVTTRECAPGCLPAPSGLNQKQLDDLYGRYGVVWCRSCVQIGGHLSLKDVRRIEDAGKLELCSTPPRQMPRPGSANGNVVKSFSRIRELYRASPTLPEDENAIAVIIGNTAYDNLPEARTARNDAGAMYFFLTEHMGVRQDQVIDLRNAARADLERVFGPVPGSDGELKRLVEARPNAKVFVYYSGHGAVNAAQDETYLLPVDAEPYREERRGYPLSTLYANLAGLGADQVVVMLESSFGRDHGNYILPPNIPETKRSALPEKAKAPLTVLVAADRGQRALIDQEYDVGLFTRYLIEGLAGDADLAPVGNGDGDVDSAELYAYTAAMVRLGARKTFGLLQSPRLSGAGTAVLKAPKGASKDSQQG
ncbi:caspase family protein [Methyloceanibacter sp. wino2]|uniref:caspase family protein n=1 Tax=Methyloceanibacter sp. wino2 TaxID=2170729 RepID=UPI00131EF2AB|nr:caspase family protein [Methyloceanibacter sp. wino2]